jgi:AcrR family transcriptional regulator
MMAVSADRRVLIMEAAIGVFLRYGYRKTSMDDLARAAGLSRQGLYLHFPSKDDLFMQAATWFAQQSLAAMQAALARDDLTLEERLAGAFAALHAQRDDAQMSLEHMNEIVATARELLGPVLEEFDQAFIAALAGALDASGKHVPWRDAGITADALARHLHAASHGLKHYAQTAADYQEGMRTAVRLVLGRPPPARRRT